MKILFKRVLSVLFFAGLSSVSSFAQDQNKINCVPPTISTSIDVTICNGQSATISVTSVGGSGAYTYQWSPATGLSSTIISNPVASPTTTTTYTIIVTDAQPCTSLPAIVTVSVNPTPTVSISGTNNTICNGQSATLTASGGITYIWAPTSETTTGIVVNPTMGTTYTVTGANANSCTNTSTYSVTVNPTPTAATVSSTTVSCNGGTNGSATVTAGGGTPAYTYVWNSGGQTTSTATGLGAGNYTIIVTDANGCTDINTVAITEPAAALSTTVTSNNATCGDTNGVATVFPSGGTIAYTYSWNTIPPQTTVTATGLFAGTYTITVTDANGCSKNDIANISNTPGPVVSTTVTPQINVACNGDSTAEATVTVTSGIGPPYTYLWSNGQTTTTATGLQAGSYNVIVIDATPCSTIVVVNITEPTALTALASSTTVSCNGGTGSATVTAGGGTPAYTYLWTSGGQTTSTVTNLTAANYTVTVTDANGCTNTNTLSITEPSALTIPASSTTGTCNGDSTGSAGITVGGGTQAYTYSWNLTIPAQTTSTAIGLVAGIYTITVTDANGCTKDTIITINNTVVTASVTASSYSPCPGTSDTLTASGGTTYIWNPGGYTTSVIIISPTTNVTYTVIVTGANGCTNTDTVAITMAAGATATANSSPATVCTGDSTILTASGGVTYLWNPGGTGSAIVVTPATTGTSSYTVTVTDANGCTGSAVANVNVIPPVNATAAGDSICPGDMAILIAQGGGTYSWSTGAVTSSISVSPPLTTIYTVTVSNGACDDTATCSVYVYPVPSAAATASSYTINLGNQTTLTGVTSTGTYNWIPSTGLSCTTCANPVANPTATTTYTLIATDTNGCIATDTVLVNVTIDCGDIFVPSAFSPNEDGHNDTFYVRSPCIKEMELVIYNRWGQKVFSTNDKTEGWDGKFNGRPVDPAVFFYTLSVRYITNTMENIEGNVSLVK